MQRIDYDEGERKGKCSRYKYVVIALGLAVGLAVGLGVGLGVGLSGRTPVCDEETTAGPGSTEQPPPAADYCPPHADPDGPWNNFRLPDYIHPVHYQLELDPNMEGGYYTGTVTVHIRTTRPTKYIWLHTKEGRLTSMPTLRSSSGSSLVSPTALPLRRCFQYTDHQYLVVEAQEQLAATSAGHEYLLTLHFHSSLLGSLVGFYKTTYTEGNIVKSIAATDHEPTDARKTFPCFDEPNKKATYTISIIHRAPYEVISNMPVEKEELDGDQKKTTFQKSVPMSTYLVCFAVHQFTYIEKISSRGIPLRIYVQPKQRHTAEFAANTTKLIFDYFETYFNFNYSLPKLDMIAIPDFGTGAMENWGLITYRETNLLFDDKESSSNNQQRVATVIAHELVHQWFGNLVTMDWWDDLWLNEGFASYFEYIGVNSAMPDWLMLDQILADDVLDVMADDALLSSHPIIVNVSIPAEITSVFDGISYSKGASILRMLRNWITPEKFQKGCQKYLRDHQYQNAKTDDFWEALTQVSGDPVKEVMDTWTRQMGFPVLSVDSNAKLTQKRFLLDVNANLTEPPSYLNYRWNIPIQWHTLNGQNGTLLFNMSKEAETLYRPQNDILKVNTDHVGFFRVQYEETAWQIIINQLQANHTEFSRSDRTGFIDDTFSLARATLLKYSVALNMTKYLVKEEDYLPWSKAISSIAYIRDMLEDDYILYPKFQMYWRKQVKPIASTLGWSDSSSHLNRLLREDVLGLSCRMGDTEALHNATSLFQEWLAGKRIAPNLRLIVYRYGMQQAGNQTSWELMFKKYQDTPLAQEKDKLLYGLASVEDIQLLDRLLKYLKNESLIKSQDVFTIIQYISYNKYGKTMAWDWTRLNWEYLVQRYTITNRNLGRLILRITRSFNTELSLWQMKDFFAKYPEAGAGEMPRKQALETVQTNIDWLNNNKKEIDQWLQSNS